MPERRALADLSHEELIELLDASLEAELRELARASAAAVIRDLPEVAWAIGAVSGPTVYRTRFREDAAARLAELTRALETFGPVTWWAGPSAIPGDLRDLLVESGYALEDDEAGMAADLERLEEELPRPGRLVITAAERPDGSLDVDEIQAWLEVNRRTLEWPDAKVARRRSLYLDDERWPHPWKHFVGRLEGEPVAASRVLLSHGIAMVHGVSTVAEARRRGIGSAVTLAALQDARARGYRIAVLQASSVGQGPYRRLGFRFVSPYGRFVRRGADDVGSGQWDSGDDREAA